MARSLKEQNNWKVWLIVAVNVLGFWVFMKSEAIHDLNMSAIAANASTVLPAGLAGIIATVINSFVSAELKARIVFCRWRHALPGHRAFSIHIRDPRVNFKKLSMLLKGRIPQSPSEQNATWYKMFKSVESRPPISDAHRTFLLLRDYASLSLLFLLLLGSVAFMYMPNREIFTLYACALILQSLLTIVAARNAGVRLVTNVLALKSI